MKRTITASFPSNIALVKYWGKKPNQHPCNASLSLTLSKAQTKVCLDLEEKHAKGAEFKYDFEGSPAPEGFTKRVLQYLSDQPEFKPLLKDYAIHVASENTFPHSAGIASSASAFSALAAAFSKAAQPKVSDFNQEVSRLARLGSGSACRSVYGPFALWGNLKEVNDSSDDYAIPINQFHPEFQDIQDTILIVEPEPKKVSSSQGHSLMNGHPYAKSRFQQANQHCVELLKILKEGDWERFIHITEREALTLHAMMMTSGHYYMLLKPGTVNIINEIIDFRRETKTPVCFSLDAGPNVHLLYPLKHKKEVNSFLAQNLQGFYKTAIFDESGEGGKVN